MPDLPEVTQDFEADCSEYLRSIQEMIEGIQEWRDDVLLAVSEAQAAINSIEGKTVTIRVITDLPPDITRTIHTVQTGPTGGLGDVAAQVEGLRQVAEAEAESGAQAEFAAVADRIHAAELAKEAAAAQEAASALTGVADAADKTAESEDKVTAGVRQAIAALRDIVSAEVQAGTAYEMLQGAVAHAEDQIAKMVDTSISAAAAQKALKKTAEEAAKAFSDESGDWEAAASAVTDATLAAADSQRVFKAATESTAEAISSESFDAVAFAHDLETTQADLAAAAARTTEMFLEMGAAIHYSDEAMAEAGTVAATLRSALGDDTAKAGAFTAAMVAAGASIKALTAGGGGGAGGGVLGALTGFFATGGGRGGIFGFLGATVAGIAAWHVILDALVEGLISIGSAAMAAATGIAVMAPTVGNLHDQLVSVHDVNSALGNQIPGLDTQFSALAKKMAPQTIEAYGGALSLVSNSTKTFSLVSSQVVNLFDTWIARIDIWARSSGVMNKLLIDGVSFLRQFGSIVGFVGDALKNLIGAMPGIAHILLGVITGFAALFDWVTKLPAPLLTAVLALHGLYIWGRLLGGALLWLATQIGNTVRGLAGLATNPLFWVAAAVVGIGALVYESGKAQGAVTGLISTMETNLSTLPASQAIVQLSTDMGTLQSHINSINLSQVENQFKGFTGAVQGAGYTMAAIWGHLVNTLSATTQQGAFKSLGESIKAVFDPLSAMGGVAISRDVAAYNAEINKMLGSSRNLFGEIGKLMGGGRSYTEALGLMDLAGVQWNDTASVMAQKVSNLIAGYEKMSISGGLLANSVNAVTFATMQQDSHVTAITQGWSAFMSMLTSGESGFTTFQLDLKTMDSSISTVSHHVGDMSLALRGAAQSITGVTPKDLELRQSFVQTALAASDETNNLITMASAAGLGRQGTAMLTQASKDLIVQMMPLAQHSQALTSILFGLAQQGGYQGADSFKALSAWLGKVKDPAKNLDAIITQLTTDSASLITDVRNLSTALGTTLTAAMSQAIFAADGGQKAFDTFATQLYKTGINSGTTKTAAQQLATLLITLTGNTSNAKHEFETMTIAMGYTKQQADKLWASVVKTATAIASLHNKSVAITESATGTGQINIGMSGTTAHAIKSGFAGATGGMVHGPGTSTSDSVPARLSAGEYVVQAASVAHYGKQMMDAINTKHFAGGGLVSNYAGSVAGLPGFTTNFDSSFTSTFTNTLASDMASSLRAAMASASAAAAKAAAASASAGPGGHVSGNALGWILGAMRLAGAPSSWLPALERLVSLECVPLRTKILTRRGWLSHDEVQVGDETIGYNLASGVSEWTKITRIYHPGKAELVRFGNRYWSVECTPNHRWIAEDIKTNRKTGKEFIAKESIIELQDWKRKQRLVIARRANTLSEIPITIEEAEIIGWLMGEGTITKAKGEPSDKCPDCGWQPGTPYPGAKFRAPMNPIRYPGVSIRNHRRKWHGLKGKQRTSTHDLGWDAIIYQSKLSQLMRLRSLLADVPHGEFVRDPAEPGYLEEHQFHIYREYSTDLLRRAKYSELSPVEFILQLSTEQRDAWLSSIIAGEGSVDGNRVRVYQDAGGISDAIQLAIYLSGRRPGRWEKKITRYWHPRKKCYVDLGEERIKCTFSMSAPNVGGPGRRSFIQSAGNDECWCVSTELGTWTAEQDHQIFLTGNSGGNAMAYDPISVGGQHAQGLWQMLGSTLNAYGGGSPWNPVTEGFAALQYIRCMPLDTLILTENGWKSYDNLSPGDRTIGFDSVTQTTRWTKISAVHYYPEAPLVRISGKRADIRCTPSHRWIAEKIIQPGAGKPSYWRPEFIETQKAGSRHRLRMAASFFSDTDLPISDAEAELIGWILTEGGIYECQRGLNVTFSQSKPANVAHIRSLLAEITESSGECFSEYSQGIADPVRRSDGVWIKANHPGFVWRLRNSYARDLIARSGMCKDLETMVLRMSVSQRGALIRSLLGGDGHYSKNPNSSPVFCQNEGDVLDAAMLAGYLSGHYIHPVDSAGQKHVTMGKPHIKFPAKYEEIDAAPVFCITTDLESWTARQSNQIFLTGNSRYGSPFNIPGLMSGHYGGYDQGGLLMPGLTLALNKTGSPETVLPPGAVLHNHITVNLDGKQVWQSVQQQQLRYNVRNSGLSRGLSSGGAVSPLQGQTVVPRRSV